MLYTRKLSLLQYSVKCKMHIIHTKFTCRPNSVTMPEATFLKLTGLGPLRPGVGGRSLESGGRSLEPPLSSAGIALNGIEREAILFKWCLSDTADMSTKVPVVAAMIPSPQYTHMLSLCYKWRTFRQLSFHGNTVGVFNAKGSADVTGYLR